MFSDINVARKINSLLLEFGSRLDNSLAIVKKECKVEEFEAYREVTGKVLGDILLEILNPIYKEHPELKPKELKDKTNK